MSQRACCGATAVGYLVEWRDKNRQEKRVVRGADHSLHARLSVRLIAEELFPGGDPPQQLAVLCTRGGRRM